MLTRWAKDARAYRLERIGDVTAFDDNLEMQHIESNGTFFRTVVSRVQTDGGLVDAEKLFPDFYSD